MLRVFHEIEKIEAAAWDALWSSDYPFTRHAFLHALEASGSIDAHPDGPSGWQAFHLTFWDNNQLLAAVPHYRKWHSYGEYVFDWSWANALHQAGVDYYPKSLCAIPFTPSTGPRWGIRPDLSPDTRDRLRQEILQALNDTGATVSGQHILFCQKDEANTLKAAGWQRRLGSQFHWFNAGYQHFDDFLAHFVSRKRKNLRKERERVKQAGLSIHMRSGRELNKEDWDRFYQLYQRTYLKRSGHGGYLESEFFHRLGQHMPDQVLLASAHRGETEKMVAAAFYLRDCSTLYGRYWGCEEEVDGLHFECCYYQGIEYAIANGIHRFDPGAQGEHKIQRGFTPVLTQSWHRLKEPALQQAVSKFCTLEARDMERYVKEARSYLPFKEGIELVPENALIIRKSQNESIPTP